MYSAVIDVVPETDYTLFLTFKNGDKKRFDMKPYLNTGIFKELQNKTIFNTVHVCYDSIAWDNEADLDPEILFENSVFK